MAFEWKIAVSLASNIQYLSVSIYSLLAIIQSSRSLHHLGSWFGKLLPVISSMDNSQLQQATEQGWKAPETNGEEANPK